MSFDELSRLGDKLSSGEETFSRKIKKLDWKLSTKIKLLNESYADKKDSLRKEYAIENKELINSFSGKILAFTKIVFEELIENYNMAQDKERFKPSDYESFNQLNLLSEAYSDLIPKKVSEALNKLSDGESLTNIYLGL